VKHLVMMRGRVYDACGRWTRRVVLPRREGFKKKRSPGRREAWRVGLGRGGMWLCMGVCPCECPSLHASTRPRERLGLGCRKEHSRTLVRCSLL
jgi:hypothetical protein